MRPPQRRHRIRLGLALLATLTALAGPVSAQALPPDLPLPQGLTLTGRIQRFEYDQDDFSYPTAKGIEHVVAAGHLWKAFFQGDASASIAAWKTVLANAGWQVLGERQDLLIARHVDWWVKIGRDRLSLVQRVDAAGLELSPPGEKI